MRLFERIPERFFSVLASGKKDLYVEAILVLRRAFQTELVIRRNDLAAMLSDSLENNVLQADFSEEAEEMEEDPAAAQGMSGKIGLLIRKLRDTGWIELEYARNSFEENITIPDYAIATMNLLHDLSKTEIREYNSYVFATYAALKNTKENPEYAFQALQSAYSNTQQLVIELKTLFNNIKRYYQRIGSDLSVNQLLEEHFDKYKTQIVDTVYYPLKTIDSVPRFKHAILEILNGWLLDGGIISDMAEEGVRRRIYDDSEAAKTDITGKIIWIADTYESIETMILEIDEKHTDYTNASIERIRYMINTDRSAKGKLIELLKNSGNEKIFNAMEENVDSYWHSFADETSLYDRVKRTVKTEGKALAVEERKANSRTVDSFLAEVRKQYSTRRVDGFILKCFGEQNLFTTEDITIDGAEDFILFLLGTIRGREKSADYTIDFLEENVDRQGYSLPKVIFKRKEKKANV